MRAVLMMSSLAMGGAERILVSVLPYLRATGLDVRLVTLNTRRDSPLTEDFVKSGIPRFDMGAKRMIDPDAWSRYVTMLRQEQIDIIHAQDQDTNIYAAAAHVRHGMPSVMTRHVLVEPMDTWKEATRARMVLTAAKYGFNRIVAVSEAVRQNFSKQAGIPLNRIETIYNGIEVERFATRHKREAKRAEMGWEKDTPIVIMVAVLRRGKGHEVLFEAVPQIQAAVPNVRIKLVGEGELSETLREQAKPYGDVVEFLGQRKDVPDLLGASDLLILPSLSEALPTVLIEAGAASLPLVATDVGGSAEIVESGKTGFIVPPGQAQPFAERIIHLLKNPVEARDMGERARARVVSMFSLEQQARQTVALYERILAQK
ncbi:MAG: glycosyltransferase family 4 protein [Chloroflexi bacterium]|nr:glycosyltransferase family 4 protein [Chloroflexota bacterium]